VELPVLITFYNRPENLRELLTKLVDIEGLQLFFASDGPRNPRDSLEIEKCWGLINNFFPESPNRNKFRRGTNLGCKNAMIGNLDWFFSQNSLGVILEDDCYPHPEFFLQMSTVLRDSKLSKYLTVSSGNYLGEIFTAPRSSVFPMIWGWGTWAENWHLYQKEITEPTRVLEFPSNLMWPSSGRLKRFYFKDTFRKRFSEVQSGDLDTWDYSLTATSWKHGRLNLHLGGNLVLNAGFNSQATHTTSHAPSWVPTKYLVCDLDLAGIETYVPQLDQVLAETVFNCTTNSVIKNSIKRILGR
jgi:hypothetical protein